jgi:hypothetical protein
MRISLLEKNEQPRRLGIIQNALEENTLWDPNIHGEIYFYVKLQFLVP